MENFILYDQLLKGESFILYKGRKKNTINFVAIKCADKSKKGEIANMVRLIHEIKHDNIVRFYEWYETSGHLWFVFELCTGGSLGLLVQQDGSLPEDTIREFGIDIAEGLYHIHSFDIIYCDLEPSKILVSGTGHLKLSDFGISRLENEDLDALMPSLFSGDEINRRKTTNDSTNSFHDIPDNLKTSGNPKYMAPEIINDENHSFSSDLWSFGCILYELCTGYPPFLAENFTVLKEKILNSEMPQPESFHGRPSDNFLDLVQGLLRKRPQSRMGWSELLTHPFWNGALIHNLDLSTPSDRHETSVEYSRDVLKQSVRQSINSFRVFKESESKHDEAVGADGRGSDSDETVTGDDGDNDTDLKGSTFRLKEGNNDDDICRHSNITNSPSLSERKQCYDGSRGSDDVRSSASEATCTSSTSVEDFGLVFHPSDFLLVPVANFKKELVKISSLKFDSKALLIPHVDVHDLSDDKLSDHLKTVVGMLLPVTSHKGTPAPQKFVQLLNYVGSIAHKNPLVSHRLVSLRVLNHLGKLSKENSQVEIKLKLCQIISVIVSCVTKLEHEIDLSEVFSNLVDAAREHSSNQKLKTSYLATMGELLTLIAKQEQEMEHVGVSWMVPPTVYSFVSRCLAEGEDVVSNLYAARIIANVASFNSNHTQRSLSIEICNNLWSMYLHGTSEFIKIAAINALMRLSKHNVTLALNLFDMHGLSQFLHISTNNNKLLQPVVTLLILILTSDVRPSRWLVDKEPLTFLMRALESSTSVVRSKSYLGVLEIIAFSNDQLLFACQNKLLSMIEKDLKRTSSDVGSKFVGYLQECLKKMMNLLVEILPRVFNEVLMSYEIIRCRKHLTLLQQKQLKYSLSLLQIIPYFVNSAVFRPKIISKVFLRSLSKLYEFLVAVSAVVQLPVILGPSSYEEFIQTTFGCSEFIVLHCSIIDDHVDIIINNILSHLSSLIACSNGELKSMSVKFFCEACIMFLSTDKMTLAKHHMKCLERLLHGFVVSMEQMLIGLDPSSTSHALRLLQELLERRSHFIRNLEETNMAAILFQVVYGHHGNVMCGSVQHILRILKCFIGCRDADLRYLFRLGFAQFLIFIFNSSPFQEPIVRPEKGVSGHDDDSSRDESRDQFFLEVLDLFHVLMKRVSEVVRGALEAKKAGQKVSPEAAEAKDLLMLNKDFVMFMTPLTRLLPHKDEDISEEALKCLGLLIQFYGGENEDSLSTDNQVCYNEYLKRSDIKKQKIMLRLIKRLITTRGEHASKMLLTNTQLLATIQNMTNPNVPRFHEETSNIAKEILQAIKSRETWN